MINTPSLTCFCTALLISVSLSAQVSQKGNVRIFNSQHTPLPGVQLMAIGAPATDTDNNGEFCFHFLNHKAGTAISSPQAYKKGYEVVNSDMLNGWILSEKRSLDIVMAPEGTIEEQKNHYYAIAIAHFSKLRNKTVQEINHLYAQQKITQAERAQRLKELAEENHTFMNMLDKYAEKFARINPDDITQIEKQVLKLVEDGKLTEAIELYNNSGLIVQARQKLQQRTQADEDIDLLAERMYRYADLCALAGGKENEQKAYDTYKWIAEILPDRFSYVLKYVLQKITLGEQDLEEWADRCQKLAFDEKSLIQVLNLKTLIATNIRKDYSKAFEYNQQALEILQQAQEAMPSGDYLAVMQITLNQTAYLLEAIHEWEQAEEVYLSNIKNLEEQIAVSDNQLFIRIQKGSLLDSYTSLMRLYSQKEDLEKARQTAAKIKEISLNDPDLNEEKRISIELNYLDMLLDFAMNAGQMKEAYKIAAEAYTKAEVLYQKNPISKAAEFLQRCIVYLQLSVDSETDAFPERAELLRTRIEQEFTSLSPDFKINALHNLEMMYSTYYSRKGNQPEERRSLVKAYQYTKKLSESSSSQFTQENLYARAKYIDVLIAESKNQEAAQEALELDALYSIQSAWGYQNLSVESSMGVALVCGGYYELGLKYLERIKEGREKELKKYPHNNELKANTCSTYNNLSLGYSKLKKYKQALREQLKAYTLMKDLYAQNKAQLGTNYMLITMNVSVNYYQNGDNQQALHYLEEASAIAEEMKALFPQYFATYPIVVKLAKGDLLSKLSQPGAQELLKEGLEYKAGSQPNDALLLYTLKEYHGNGLYTK
ncbi:tetratricopeptide repeat protein [Phocaeicola plebeius]|uniref:tetratricopeptide repeat protein n=1 Tax=Phocaeicola plebeius TaxID=310297 RepID=UPI0026ED57F1|nr:tetratricopeptide repeat protein [Phocaeicola plebeius]